jgi:hypothetical protein
MAARECMRPGDIEREERAILSFGSRVNTLYAFQAGMDMLLNQKMLGGNVVYRTIEVD